MLALKFLTASVDTSWDPLPSRAADNLIPYSGVTCPLAMSRETTEYFWLGGVYCNVKEIIKQSPLNKKIIKSTRSGFREGL